MLRNLLFVLFSQFVVISAMAGGLRVGLSPDYPPLVFKQEGRIVGIEADNVRAVSEIIGQKMTLVEMPFERLLPALQAGEIDVIMSGFSVTAQRSEQVIFIDAYMQMGQMAIMHRDKVAQFAQPWSVYREGVRIGVEPGTTGASFAEQELKDAQIKYIADATAAFAGLRNDEIDLYIHDAPTSWQLATSTENNDLISLYSPLTNEMLAWAVRKDDDRLAGELNRALAKMKTSGTLRYILNRWIPVTVEVR
ncbi:MAG: amino acid ABC transporter substrate-binding protein [Gammaproteobacteria bacterium]|nr:MAG: amino acid ABC transporter substrate-binding protein [Gammaproteobacteria bacterium]